MRLTQAFDLFLEEKELSEKSIKTYSYDFKRMLTFFGNIDIKNMNKKKMKKFVDDQSKRYSARTVRRLIAFIKSFERFLTDYDYLSVNWSGLLRIPRIDKVRVNRSIHTKVDIYRLIGDIHNKQERAIVAVALLSGLRLSEIAALNHDDIKLNGLLVRHGKGNKERLVVLSDTLRHILYDFVGTPEPREPLFISSRRLRMSEKTIARIIHKHTGTNPHSCRVTFATILIKNGCDIETLRSNLGHDSINTTQIYIDISREESAETAKQFIR